MFRTSPKIGDRWEVPKDEINESEFDESRRCLLNTYNSYIQTHAGYMIALIIGFLALLSSFRSFIDGGLVAVIFFVILLAGVLKAFSYILLRITFWSSFANDAISLSQGEVIRSFIDANPKKEEQFFKEAPCTGILHGGIFQFLKTGAHSRYSKLVYRTEQSLKAIVLF